MRQKQEAQLAELKASHESKMKETVAAHEASVDQLRKQHEVQVRTLEDAAKTAEEKHLAELERLEAALKKEREQLAQVQQTAQRLEESLREAQAEVAALQERLQALERSHAEAMQKKDANFSREKRHLKEQHKADLERQLEQQVKATAELKEQFDRARHLQDLQLDMLQKRVQELQDLYDNR